MLFMSYSARHAFAMILFSPPAVYAAVAACRAQRHMLTRCCRYVYASAARARCYASMIARRAYYVAACARCHTLHAAMRLCVLCAACQLRDPPRRPRLRRRHAAAACHAIAIAASHSRPPRLPPYATFDFFTAIFHHARRHAYAYRRRDDSFSLPFMLLIRCHFDFFFADYAAAAAFFLLMLLHVLSSCEQDYAAGAQRRRCALQHAYGTLSAAAPMPAPC